MTGNRVCTHYSSNDVSLTRNEGGKERLAWLIGVHLFFAFDDSRGGRSETAVPTDGALFVHEYIYFLFQFNIFWI